VPEARGWPARRGGPTEWIYAFRSYDMTDPHASQLRRTPLTGVHERLGATLTGFAGWLMPLRYGSETAEHNAVRTAAGLFDLSHMGEITVTGPGAAAALDYAVTGQPSALAPGRARYTMICAPDGGIIDDLIVYRLADAEFLVVANAANTRAVFQALTGRAAGRGARVTDRTADYALIAVQGPNAEPLLAPVTKADVPSAAARPEGTGGGLGDLRYYAICPATVAGCQVLAARTGYTGEDGFELFVPAEQAERAWDGLMAAGSGSGLRPAGLAARDTLRLEAGMPLYGSELGPDVTPFDAGLGRVVSFGKPGDFVGRAALEQRAQSAPQRELVGLAGRSRRVPRHGYGVLWDGNRCGTVTSGAPSPTLGLPIAMAYVEAGVARQARTASPEPRPGEPDGGDSGRLAVDIRGSAEPAGLVPLPFYRRPS
jgi:aminomethyltransferase